MDLIERQAAIRWVKTECNPYGKPTLEFESGKKVIEHLEQMPSAEPQRKKCKWCENLKERNLRIEYYWIDNEGCTASFQDKEGHVVATGIARFCPNCGADMRGEQDE